MEEIDGWLGRNEDKELWVYTLPPYKLSRYWECDDMCMSMCINPNLFPEVKWSDEEPTKVKLKIIKQ